MAISEIAPSAVRVGSLRSTGLAFAAPPRDRAQTERKHGGESGERSAPAADLAAGASHPAAAAGGGAAARRGLQAGVKGDGVVRHAARALLYEEARVHQRHAGEVAEVDRREGPGELRPELSD